MTLLEIIKHIQDIAKVNHTNSSFVGDIYELNHKQDIEYPAFVVTQGTHQTNNEEDLDIYNLNLFYVDRLLEDKSNELDVQDWAYNGLSSIIDALEVGNIGFQYTASSINTFTERFDSLCAGAFANLQIQVEKNSCITPTIVTSVNGHTGDVFIKGIEPPYVKTINGKEGDVILTTKDLKNDSGYVTKDETISKEVYNTHLQAQEERDNAQDEQLSTLNETKANKAILLSFDSTTKQIKDEEGITQYFDDIYGLLEQNRYNVFIISQNMIFRPVGMFKEDIMFSSIYAEDGNYNELWYINLFDDNRIEYGTQALPTNTILYNNFNPKDNFKTINSQSLIGKGNIEIKGEETKYIYYIDEALYKDKEQGEYADFQYVWNLCMDNNRNVKVISDENIIYQLHRVDDYSVCFYSLYGEEGLYNEFYYINLQSDNYIDAGWFQFADTNAISRLERNKANKTDLEQYNKTNNFKTINNQSIIGTGNIDIQGGGNNTLFLMYDDGEEMLVDKDGKQYEFADIKELFENGTDVKIFMNDINHGALMRLNYVTDDAFYYAQVDAENGYVENIYLVIYRNGNFESGDYQLMTDFELSEVNTKVSALEKKVTEIELTKFPNVTLFGSPTIQGGQIKGFTADNYAQFPFLVDFQSKPFEINMCVTMGANVTAQENIFDSEFGLAFAVRNGRFVLAMSSDGQSWDMGEHTGTRTSVKARATYYLRLNWNGSMYRLLTSANKTTWTTDITITDARTLYPKQIVIGKSLDNAHIFGGSINLNYCTLDINSQRVWDGMDDVGLSTRLATDLSNIDAQGKQEIKNIVSTEFATIAYVDEKIGNISNALTIILGDE